MPRRRCRRGRSKGEKLIEYVECKSCGEEWTRLKNGLCPVCIERNQKERVLKDIPDARMKSAGEEES